MFRPKKIKKIKKIIADTTFKKAMRLVVPLAHFEGLGLVEQVVLGSGFQTSQWAWHQNPGSVGRHGTDRGAGVSQQLPQAGQVWTELHRPEGRREEQRVGG